MDQTIKGQEQVKLQQNGKSKKDAKKWIILFILLFLILIGILAVLFSNQGPKYENEVAAKVGQLDGKSEAEIRDELNRVVEEGMFHVVINSDPIFRDGTSRGNLEIENIPNNLYLMRVEIINQKTEEVIYSTKYIEPNSHIQEAQLEVNLPKGDYPATAIFYAYDKESLVEIGSTACEICVHVLN